LLKNKAAAVFLGPSGVGLVGLYISATLMIALLAAFNASDVVATLGQTATTTHGDWLNVTTLGTNSPAIFTSRASVS
jgi:hypothetical protein